MAKATEKKCSFCERAESEVNILFTGAKGMICDACIENAHILLQDAGVAGKAATGTPAALSLHKPKEIKAFLDQYVIGQDQTKKVMAVAVYNHYKRLMQQELNDEVEIEKSNIALEATKDKIDTDVNRAYVKYAESMEIIPTFKKDVELSQSNYKIVKSRYDNDFALISDMVDAEIQLNASKISLINANLDLMIQYYALQFAMGKL